MIRRIVLAAAFFLTARNAAAFTKWPSTREVAETILRIWAPYVYEYYESFKQYMTTTQEVTTDQKNLAFAKLGDSVTSNMRRLYQQEQARAAEPPPAVCKNRALGEAGGSALNQRAKQAREYTYGGDVDTASVGISERRARRRTRAVRRAKNRARNRPGDEPYLSAAALTTPAQTPKDYNPYEFAQHLMGDTEYLAERLPPAYEGREAAVPYEDLRATHLARISIVRNALHRTIALRTPSKDLLKTAVSGADPESRNAIRQAATDKGIAPIDLLAFEIDQTYGSEQFRTELLQYSDPTPVFKTISHILALRSRLLHEISALQEQRNLLLSAYTATKMETGDNIERLYSSWNAAFGED